MRHRAVNDLFSHNNNPLIIIGLLTIREWKNGVDTGVKLSQSVQQRELELNIHGSHRAPRTHYTLTVNLTATPGRTGQLLNLQLERRERYRDVRHKKNLQLFVGINYVCSKMLWIRSRLFVHYTNSLVFETPPRAWASDLVDNVLHVLLYPRTHLFDSLT